MFCAVSHWSGIPSKLFWFLLFSGDTSEWLLENMFDPNGMACLHSDIHTVYIYILNASKFQDTYTHTYSCLLPKNKYNTSTENKSHKTSKTFWWEFFLCVARTHMGSPVLKIEGTFYFQGMSLVVRKIFVPCPIHYGCNCCIWQKYHSWCSWYFIHPSKCLSRMNMNALFVDHTEGYTAYTTFPRVVHRCGYC